MTKENHIGVERSEDRVTTRPCSRFHPTFSTNRDSGNLGVDAQPSELFGCSCGHIPRTGLQLMVNDDRAQREMAFHRHKSGCGGQCERVGTTGDSDDDAGGRVKIGQNLGDRITCPGNCRVKCTAHRHVPRISRVRG